MSKAMPKDIAQENSPQKALSKCQPARFIQAVCHFLSGKSILLLGFGREGQSMLSFLTQHLPDAKLAIADQNPIPEASVTKIIGQKTALPPLFTGPSYLDSVKKYDVIIKSPGVAIKDLLPPSEKAKITSMTDLFLRFNTNPIIGVTGTKGKSTTSALIAHLLNATGRKALLVGNIGEPCFNDLSKITPETVIVYELSAHQLEYVQKSPAIAVLLNIYEEHFDHYAKPADYYHAKQNIFRFQTAKDTLIYGDIFRHTTRAQLQAVKSHQINFLQDFTLDPKTFTSPLKGAHFFNDIKAALAACEALGQKRAALLPQLASFKPLPHRLQYVGKFKDIDFYNDSIATASEAVMSALKTFPQTNTIILGGLDRGLNYHALVDFILRQTQVEHILLMPGTAERFTKLFHTALKHHTPKRQFSLHSVTSLEEAVQLAYQHTKPGHVCLLSPAAASYNAFKNFEDRGNQFMALVKKYGA